MNKLIITSVSVIVFAALFVMIGAANSLSEPVIVKENFFQITNKHRLSQNLPQLKVSKSLTESAQAKADDLCNLNYWSHTRPNGEEFSKSMTYTGTRVGENLAQKFDTDEGAFQGLIKSPTHLANIVGDYDEIGIGRNYCGGRNIIVSHFGEL